MGLLVGVRIIILYNDRKFSRSPRMSDESSTVRRSCHTGRSRTASSPVKIPIIRVQSHVILPSKGKLVLRLTRSRSRRLDRQVKSAFTIFCQAPWRLYNFSPPRAVGDDGSQSPINSVDSNIVCFRVTRKIVQIDAFAPAPRRRPTCIDRVE